MSMLIKYLGMLPISALITKLVSIKIASFT